MEENKTENSMNNAPSLDDVTLSKRIRLAQRKQNSMHDEEQKEFKITTINHRSVGDDGDRRGGVVERFIDSRKGRKECMWIENVPAKSANAIHLDEISVLSREMKAVFREVGIFELFSHQLEAIRLAKKNESVMVCTPKASGKSLCYVIPILEKIMLDDKSKALLMYPLKSLSNDQSEKMSVFLQVAKRILSRKERIAIPIDIEKIDRLATCEIKVCDGDSTLHQKKKIRSGNANRIIITNPD